MKTHTMKLITIISEALLEEYLIKEFKTLKIKGYSISKIVGDSEGGLKLSDVEGDNIKVEIVLSEENALSLFSILNNKYFPNYSIIAYMHDVQVLRQDKFK